MNKINGLISLSMKAGKLISGEDSCLKSVRSGKAYLVIVAKDAGFNTKKLFADKCSFRKIRFIEFMDKEMLGQCIGKAQRAVISIEDKGFGDSIIKLIQEEQSL